MTKDSDNVNASPLTQIYEKQDSNSYSHTGVY